MLPTSTLFFFGLLFGIGGSWGGYLTCIVAGFLGAVTAFQAFYQLFAGVQAVE